MCRANSYRPRGAPTFTCKVSCFIIRAHALHHTAGAQALAALLDANYSLYYYFSLLLYHSTVSLCCTCMQAHERGELVQAQDDATYALDGLVPEASLDTQRESVCGLLEIMATRRGRVALRCV